MNEKEKIVIRMFFSDEAIQSSGVYEILNKEGTGWSLITVKRLLSKMAKKGWLKVFGMGRKTEYKISVKGRVLAEVDSIKYCEIEPDKRYGLNKYNFDLWKEFPKIVFNSDEMERLEIATNKYRKRITGLSNDVRKKEIERLIIELSWKSSKIEGNTYSLLDTEKLIRENIKAAGKSKEETQMILNHKNVFQNIYKNRETFKLLSINNIENIHAGLVEHLGIRKGLRKKPVGITGSKYNPLDNVFQIEEALIGLIGLINDRKNPYEKSLLALVGLGYIQPFNDGNKRTARMLANALLMANRLTPLSYRSIDEGDYKAAMIVFYEINSIVAIKDIFIEQYEFAADQYQVV